MDTTITPPWEHIDSALTADHLSAVAMIIVRETNAKIAKRDERDSAWNLGCDCHAWRVRAIHDAAERECRGWLVPTTKRGDLDLKFCIGGPSGVNVKMYRPDSPEQPSRTLKQALEHHRVLQTSLGPELSPDPDPEVRFAFDTDQDGRIAFVRLVQLSLSGELLYSWPVWTADAALSIEDAPRRDAIELDEPRVRMQEDVEAENREAEDDQQHGA
jgi:hypothetical protein